MFCELGESTKRFGGDFVDLVLLLYSCRVVFQSHLGGLRGFAFGIDDRVLLRDEKWKELDEVSLAFARWVICSVLWCLGFEGS